MSKRKKKKLLSIVLALVLLAAIYIAADMLPDNESQSPTYSVTAVSGLDSIPEYSGEAYCTVNGNTPFFEESELTSDAFESFAELDSLGRCGVTMACVGQELMPTEDRESISHVHPSGWVNNPYSFVDGEYLYNRCHLIGFQLTGENDNEQNLITGTRYMNVEGMLPFENMVADYVKETGDHVLYRVTPIFKGDELVARGVLMEALSVEDKGEGICFNVYCYNVQPGVKIDYSTGENVIDEEYFKSMEQNEYVLNTNSKKFHLPECSGASDMKEENRDYYVGPRELVISRGYEPCGQCNP